MKYIFPFLLMVCSLAAQEKVSWDTTRYQKFKSNLIIGVFQSYYDFNNEINQKSVPDPDGFSHHHYKAESNLITGVALTYDKFSLSLGLQSKPQDGSAGKGVSTTFAANFNIGANRWFIENSIRYFKGFYDDNTPNLDTSFKKTGVYHFEPGFSNTLVRSKFMYFTNHRRYSFRANSSCNYRQRRSAATWILSANTNYNFIHNDSSLFRGSDLSYYGDYSQLMGLSSFGLSLNAGAAVTFVIWRSVFISSMFIIGPEQQWRKYLYPDRTTNLSYLSVSSDFRIAFGMNLKRFYFISYACRDVVFYNSSFLQLTNRSISGGLIMGWRFNSHVPGFYKKFQTTKLYLAL
ncbi:MAG: DUF4421 family protein [bacterium]|nr:DUF4421 family protein [bacterium]